MGRFFGAICALIAAGAGLVAIAAWFAPRPPTASAQDAFELIAESTDPCDFADFVRSYPTDAIYARRARAKLVAIGATCAEQPAAPTTSVTNRAREFTQDVRVATLSVIRDFGPSSAEAAVSQPFDGRRVPDAVRSIALEARQAEQQCASIRGSGESGQFYDGTYFGTNVSGMWTGCGMYVFETGDRHTGRWGANGTYTLGVLRFADGRRYEGQFFNMRTYGYDMIVSGVGVLWSADGDVIGAGEWADGRLVRAL